MQSHDLATVKATAGMATAGTGLATYLEVLSSALGLVATVLGICLTSWLIYKEVRAEKERRAAKRGDLKRRATDGEDNG